MRIFLLEYFSLFKSNYIYKNKKGATESSALVEGESEREKSNYLSNVIFFVIFVEPDSKVYKYNPLGKFSALKVSS